VKSGNPAADELLQKWRAEMDAEELEETIRLLDHMRRGLIERVVEMRTEAVEPVVRCRHRRRLGGSRI
jgi:hypothetical protein